MYQYSATVENVVDGDTVDLAIDLGFKIITKQRVRLARVDTPERGQPGFAEAKEFVVAKTAEKNVTLHTEKVSKWGYYLAEITLADGSNLSDALLAGGYGKPYDGGKKQ